MLYESEIEFNKKFECGQCMLSGWIIAAPWGFIGGIALLLGSIIGYNFKLPQHSIASIRHSGRES